MISIVVNNFNYAEFVGDAIDSALAQTHPQTEVIVVDDGSTDRSRAVIERYRDRVRAIYKENHGQPSAFNAGFGESRGDVVIFLDSDDMILRDTAARVADRFRLEPELAKVQYRLEVIDSEGRATDELVPPAQFSLSDGDLREVVLRTPDDFVFPPSSGNAYSADVVRRLFPLREDVSADAHLMNMAALLGPVATLAGIGGRYRVHSRNMYYSPTLRLESVRYRIEKNAIQRRALAELAWSLGRVAAASEVRPTSVTDLALRLVSLRLEPEQHPVAGDTKLGLAAGGLAAVIRHPRLPLGRRVLYGTWFVAAALAPRGASRWLSKRLIAAWRTGSLRAGSGR